MLKVEFLLVFFLVFHLCLAHGYGGCNLSSLNPAFSDSDSLLFYELDSVCFMYYVLFFQLIFITMIFLSQFVKHCSYFQCFFQKILCSYSDVYHLVQS